MTPNQMVKMLDEQLSDALDEIDALKSELTDAVETAFWHGAVEWTKSNYPAIYKRQKEGQSDE